MMVPPYYSNKNNLYLIKVVLGVYHLPKNTPKNTIKHPLLFMII